MTAIDGPPPLREVFATMSLRQKIGMLATTTVVIGGLFGIMNQLAVAEPYWIASRSFVRESVAQATSNIVSRQIATQIQFADSEYSRIQNELANKQVLLDQNPTMSQAIRNSILEQIRSLQRSLEATKYQLDELRREQSGRRP